jgi:hypothetical protein
MLRKLCTSHCKALDHFVCCWMRPSRSQQVLVSKEPFFRLIDCLHSWRFPRCLTPSYFRSTHCAFSFSSQVFLKVELIFNISFFLHAHTITTSYSLSSAQYFLLSYFSEKFNFSLYFSWFVLNFSKTWKTRVSLVTRFESRFFSLTGYS